MPRSGERSLIFRLNDNGQGPEIVQQVFLENGWQEFDEATHDEDEWNLWWRTSRFRNSDYERLRPWQRLNHYPRSTAITKKDCLARNMKRMRGVYGPQAYNFSPVAFNLPNDYTRFVAEYTRQREKKSDVCWICKPADLSRGRGIFIFRDLSELQYDCSAVVQQYISNPLLISGYKFDLRLYVVVPSFHPLRVYVYEEGLVRFGTEKFDLNALGNHYAHLTNTSINKHSPSYMMDKERVGAGCKWTLRQLRHYFHQVNIDDNQIWGRIVNIVVLTLVVQAVQVPKVERCFELYGFDVMIDADLKPWLLEVNFSPALSSDCQADVIVKKGMLADLLQIMGFGDEDKVHGAADDDAARLGRRVVRTIGPTSNSSPSDRRHSFGYGRRKDSSEHLPKIASGGHGKTSREGETNGTSDDDDEPPVIPIIPGCGLPSVQQTVLHRSLAAPPSVCPENGCEGTSSNGTGFEQGSKNSTKKATRNGRVRPPEQEAKLGSSPHRNSSHNNFVPGANDQNAARNVKPPAQRRDAKVSAQSDSGFSSYSGSSDNSDVVSHSEERVKSASKAPVDDGTVGRPVQDAPGKSRIVGPRRRNGVETVESGPTPAQRSGRTTRQPSRRPPAPSRSGGSETRTGRGNPAPVAGRSSHFASFASNAAAKPRSGPLHPLSELGSGTVKGRNVNRSQWYAKSDAVSSRNGLATIPQIGMRTPPARVGDFIRVFPFNDATNKCSLGNMDIKTVIRECHKLLRERTRVVTGQKKGKVQHCSLSQEQTVPDNLFDVPFIWKPFLGDGVIQ